MRFATLLTKITLPILVAATPALAATRIQILNIDQQPVAGASVQVVSTDSTKPAEPPLTSDANGFVNIPDAASGSLSLNIAAQGYITTSFLNLENRNGSVQLHRQDSRQAFEIKGEAVNFQNIKKDGKVDFGLVYPALSRRDLLQFDVSSVVSTETDQIKVITQTVNVPSNLTLPDQQESYVLPVRLNKPVYRMYVQHPGTYRMMATHGQFPLKQVINEMQNGKSIFDVINYFKFMNAGERDVNVTGNIAGQDIDVNQIHFDSSVQVQSPTIPAGLAVVSATLVDQDGLFFPADLKNVKSNETQTLNLPQNAPDSFVLSLMTADRKPNGGIDTFDGSPRDIATMINMIFGKMTNGMYQPFGGEPAVAASSVSIALQRTAARVNPEFLDLVAAPQALPNKIVLSTPASKSAVVPVATYAILSEIQTADRSNGNYAAEKRYRMWEVFQPGWASEINLPQVDMPKQPGKKYRWEILFLGQTSDFNNRGGYFLDGVTHVSRTSVDL